MSNRSSCQGCHARVEPADLTTREAEGNQCRYCEACLVAYDDFVAACAAEEKRLNVLLDTAVAEFRDRTSLAEVPQDFARRKGMTFQPLVLG